jgi:putative addiction module antidote
MVRYNVSYNLPMPTSVKVTTVGSSVGIVLPREILEKLRVEKGDILYVTETPEGVQLTPYQRGFAEKIEVAKKVMRRNRDALRKLAE